eukprot:GFYU01017995.1.p1 GENE.GFYU01017995.1~~GFYU01017995.1.p1  ORF type:complete len:756 (-),score=199.13 GFYU01017995.1:100-2367(-)
MADIRFLLGFVLAVGLLGLAAAAVIGKWVLNKPSGSMEMEFVSEPIKEGAEGYMKTQYTTIFRIATLFAVILGTLTGIQPVNENDQDSPKVGHILTAVLTAGSFLLGAFSSAIAGFIGMWVAVRVNVRTASAATRSYREAVSVAFVGGSCSSLVVVSINILGLSTLVFVLAESLDVSIESIPRIVVGYGFGASFVALFAQLGGGIFTKAADVGADQVGKVEAGIPDDDPRNPAVIADLVGDNVGDCAGRGADIFESLAAENIGAMMLGATINSDEPKIFILFPLVVHALGIVCCCIGMLFVRARRDFKDQYFLTDDLIRTLEDPLSILQRGYAVSCMCSIGSYFLGAYMCFHTKEHGHAWFMFACCGVIGIITSILTILSTAYYTHPRFKPVRMIAEASTKGHSVNIIQGLAVGMESTALPLFFTSVGLLSSYYLGFNGGFTADNRHSAGLFGTACATTGFLQSAAFILAMDNFGPIVDNAAGIVEMSQQPDNVCSIAVLMDAAGNTTKALTKGYAIASAALATFLLFSSYINLIGSYANTQAQRMLAQSVNLFKPEVFVGALLGGMVVFLFSSMSIKAVGVTTGKVVEEVRRQFRERPGIVSWRERPDYRQCVTIVTQESLKQMIAPGVLSIGAPLAVGFLFRAIGSLDEGDQGTFLGAQAAAGFLLVATITGILMSSFQNNAGAVWDNAKKYIESGHYGGKNSTAHAAAVTGDTVGDPLKDVAGPALHVLVKLLATLIVVVAPLFINEPVPAS